MQAIKCVAGDVGSGKTLYIVSQAILSAQAGRNVYINFPMRKQLAMDYPEIAKHIHYIPDFYKFLKEREKEARVESITEFRDLFIIDDAWIVWNARDAMTTRQKQSIKYVLISRKLGLELLMSAQLARNLDIILKALVTVWIVATKLPYQVAVNHWLYYFKYEYYHPESGDLKTTYLSPSAAARFYPYYDTTQQLNVPVELEELNDEVEPEERMVTVRQFTKFRDSTSIGLKELRTELETSRKEIHNELTLLTKELNNDKQNVTPQTSERLRSVMPQTKARTHAKTDWRPISLEEPQTKFSMVTDHAKVEKKRK